MKEKFQESTFDCKVSFSFIMKIQFISNLRNIILPVFWCPVFSEGPPVDVRTVGEFNIFRFLFISNCLILNFSILQTWGSDYTVVSVLDLKTVDFSMDERSR